MTGAEERPRLVPEGLRLGDRTVPLYAGSVHYFRLERGSWRRCLESVRDMGIGIIDIYIPWGVHERSPGEFDFGEHDPRLDVERFLELSHELGLLVIVRPGPHINAELTYFGIPERVVFDPRCQARSPRGNPVVLPMLPVSFPVPSYASEVFHQETARWFEALGPRLARHVWPRGPIVLVQVDNEGALYFRDSAYDQDYGDDAVALYRGYLRDKHGDDERLSKAYGRALSLASIEPPRRFDAARVDELPWHLEWVEFHEHLLAWALGRMAEKLAEVGLAGVPTTHNLPFGQETTPLNSARIARVIDLVAFDYYHRASPLDRRVIARRTGELSCRSEGTGKPAFAAEMGAGYAPFFPPLSERDAHFTLLVALAHGLRGFNLYMVVNRDRWIGGPIDPYGARLPSASFYERLIEGLLRVGFERLKRRVPVRLVTPRSQRRLSRAMHAFGPLSGAFFAVAGATPRERCFEDDLGVGAQVAVASEDFLSTFEQALEARGVPFAHVGGEDSDVSLGGARWVICGCPGGLKPELLSRLREQARGGVRVTVGPLSPTRDGQLLPQDPAPSLEGLELCTPGEGAQLSPAEADRLVSHAIDELGLSTFAADPDGVEVCVHEDAQGAPRVVFVVNAGRFDVVARCSVPGVGAARDLLDQSRVQAASGSLEVRVPPHSVRVVEVIG